jgi:hypothetical protein
MSVAKRLEREIKANPAKAGGLGVLLLVACYFWAPLVMGFFQSDGGEVVQPAATPPSPAATTSTLVPAGQTMPTETPTYEWRKYSKAIEEDARMNTGSQLSEGNDPFDGPPIIAPPKPEPPVETPPVVMQPVTPADVGLELTTTLLGARRKIAEIGGKSYTVGDRIETEQDGANASFTIVEIYPRRVVLESNGERYELRIPRPLVDSVAEQPPRAPAAAELPEPAPDTEQYKTGDREPESGDPGSATN